MFRIALRCFCRLLMRRLVGIRKGYMEGGAAPLLRLLPSEWSWKSVLYEDSGAGGSWFI